MFTVVRTLPRLRSVGGWTLMAALFLTGKLMVTHAAAADFCWSPEQLRHVDGSERIRKDQSVPLIPMPRSAAAPPSSTFKPVSGAVRRVTLPAGAPKLVALTFDLCEQPYEVAGYQGTLVDYLREKSIKATFFAGGKWMLSHPTRAQQLMADPLFEVANHSWEHRNLRVISGSKLDDEIKAPQVAYELLRDKLAKRQCLARDGRPVQRTTSPRMTLFRFPFGACNDKALEAVNENGLIAVQWDVSSGDPDKHLTAAGMVDSVLKLVRPGSIILFHANGRGWHTADALPKIIAELARAQFKFVTVSELLQFPGAKWEVKQDCYDARPGDTNRYDGLARALEAQYERFYARFSPAKRDPLQHAPEPPMTEGPTKGTK